MVALKKKTKLYVPFVPFRQKGKITVSFIHRSKLTTTKNRRKEQPDVYFDETFIFVEKPYNIRTKEAFLLSSTEIRIKMLLH